MRRRWFVDARLDTEQHIQSKDYQTHQDAARCAADLADRMMVEIAIVIDSKTGEVKHSFDGRRRRIKNAVTEGIPLA